MLEKIGNRITLLTCIKEIQLVGTYVKKDLLNENVIEGDIKQGTGKMKDDS